MKPRFARRHVLAAGSTVLAGCTGPISRRARGHQGRGPIEPTHDTTVSHEALTWTRFDPDWAAPTTTPEVDLIVETVIENLEIPWDLAFARNGDLFVSERPGRVRWYRDGTVRDLVSPTDAIEADSIPPGSQERSWFVRGGEGGTMGVAVHPRYPNVPLVYVYYTAETDAGTVNRLAYVDASSTEPWRHRKTILNVPAGRIHNGGRIAFGPANYLWITTGETGKERLAQDPTSLAGKVLRVTAEGEPAPGNPDLGSGAAPELFTLGHRNPQGIAWTPDGTPIVDEHGPVRDEVSVLEAGGNYGWPKARTAASYNGTAFSVPVASSAVEGTTWAPGGSVFYTGSTVPFLRNRLLVGCLVSHRLKVFTLTRPGEVLPPLGETGTRHDADWLDDRFSVTSHDLLVGELGRIRHVEQSPTGELYAITSNRDGRASGPFPMSEDDRLVRVSTAPKN